MPPRTRSRVPPPRPTFDEIKEQVDRCKLLQERTFDNDTSVEFYRQLRAAGLHRMVRPKQVGNEMFVRYFYAFAKCYTSFRVGFRHGRVTSITAEGIRRFFHIPARSQCRYEELKNAEEDFPWQEIAETLGGTWEPKDNQGQLYLSRGHMNATARNWLIFVCSYLQPSSHMTHIPPKLGLLLYLLMTGQPVKVEDIIFDSLHDCAINGRRNRSLILPHMISDMFTDAGIPEEPTDIHFQPKEPANYARISAPVAQPPPPVDPDIPSTSQAPQRSRSRSRVRSPAPPPPPEPQMMELLHTLVDDQRRILQNQEFFREQLHQINRRLDTLCPSPMDRAAQDMDRRGSIDAPHYSGATMPLGSSVQPGNPAPAPAAAAGGDSVPVHFSEDEGER